MGRAKPLLSSIWLCQCLGNQKGAFPPFMFGLLMGVSVFSMVSAKMAEKQIVTLQDSRADRLKAEQEDIAKGLEFAILTETAETYSDDLSLNRARQHMARSSGKTMGRADAQLVSRRDADAFGASQERILITNTDDVLTQATLNQAADAKDLAANVTGTKGGITLFNSADVRFRQVEKSKKNLDMMGESLYRFYAGQLRFPTLEEYEILAEQLKLRDFWGTPFEYKRIDDAEATLTFTTPWNYTQTIHMNLN